MFSISWARTATASVALIAASTLTTWPADAVSGGAAANLGFAVKIAMEGRGCSGALVEPTLVLTAASCFPENPQGGAPAKATTVTVGGHTTKVTTLLTRSDRDAALARIDTTITDVAPLALSAAVGVPGTSEQLSLA